MTTIIELIKKADEMVQVRNYAKALDLYMQAINLFRKTGKKNVTDEILTAYNNAVVLMLQIANSKNMVVKAKDLCRELVKLTRKAENRSDMYAIAKFHLGLIHMALGEFKDAVENFEEALYVFEIIEYKEGIMLACKNLADCYKALGLKTKAEAYMNRAKAYDNGDLKTMDWINKVLKSVPWVIK